MNTHEINNIYKKGNEFTDSIYYNITFDAIRNHIFHNKMMMYVEEYAKSSWQKIKNTQLFSKNNLIVNRNALMWEAWNIEGAKL